MLTDQDVETSIERDIPLPQGLTQIGGSCDLSGYSHPLPQGLKVGGRIIRG